jgi:amino acid adenylation domain-containing protein
MENQRYLRKKTFIASQFTRERDYWLEQLAGDLVRAYFPYEWKPSIEMDFRIDSLEFSVSGEDFSRLLKLCSGVDAKLYIFLMTGIAVLLNQYTGIDDIVIGSPLSKQDVDRDLVNTVLALRNFLTGDMLFKELLLQVSQTVMEAAENQNYPIETLLYQLGMTFAVYDFPLFDVVVLLENIHNKNYLKPINPNMIFSFLRNEESLRGVVEYNAARYDKIAVERIVRYFIGLVHNVLLDINIKISDIDLLSEEEKETLLYNLNNINAEYPRDKTIHQLFQYQVEKTPGSTAVEYENRRLTYGELNDASNRLARVLKRKGVTVDTIVGLMVEPSLEMAAAILAILKAGGAYMPIDSEFPRDRVIYMLADSSTSILLTTAGAFAKYAFTAFRSLEITVMDEWEETLSRESRENLQPVNRPNDLAYVLYTSGTSGKPKGVMIEHKNVVALMFHDNYRFDFSGSDVWTMFHAYNFDFSVWEMYGPLLHGGKLILISKMTARDPGRFFKILEEKGVTVLNQTPPAFYNLIDEALKNGNSRLKLRYVIFGGEALQPLKLKPWKEKYPDVRLVNMFGITETTVHATYKEIGSREIQQNVSNIGKPLPTLRGYILDRGMKLLPIGVSGELYIGGEGVGRGYLNNPGLTGERFMDSPFVSEERVYKSGDLVKLIEDVEMEYLGRIDHQVKIRGFRIELEEIRNQLLSVEDITDAVVIDRDDESDEKFLTAYVVSKNRKEMDTSALRNILSRKLPDYMIPTSFVLLEKIPLTPNGKIDRKVLPEPEIKVGDRYAAPADEIEARLINVSAEVLNVNTEVIGMNDNFFELGGNSLKAVNFAAMLHKEFNVKIPLDEIFNAETFRGLSDYIKGAVESKYTPIKIAEKKEYYILSSAQKRMYFLHRMDPLSISYNTPLVIPIIGNIDYQKMEGAFRKLVDRHDSLRTSLTIINGRPVQRIHESNEGEFEIEYIAEGTGERELIQNSFIRPFDLGKMPLMRVGLIKSQEETYLLMVDMHHIVSDGVSLNITVKDFIALYDGKELAELRLQYKDYSEWLNSAEQKNVIKKQEEYWIKEFSGEIPVFSFPTDYPRPSVRSFAGDRIIFQVNKELTGKIKGIAAELELTLHIFFLAAYNILLSRYSKQEDIIVGMGITGRTHADLQNIVGMFVNMLPVRNRPERGKTSREFLLEVKVNALNAYKNQDYQLEELISRLGITAGLNRNPLFETVFQFQNTIEKRTGGAHLPGDGKSKTSPYRYEHNPARYDLIIEALEFESSVKMVLTYSTALFRRATMEKFANRFLDILGQLAANDEIKLKDIVLSHDLLTAAKDTAGFDFGFESFAVSEAGGSKEGEEKDGLK